MKTELLPFGELNTLALYKILDLRNKVFVLEQNCVYLDTDYKDLDSFHLMMWDDAENLHGYSRLIPPGVSYPGESSIGRVITSAEKRGSGLGKRLMKESMENILKLFPDYPVRIEAQSYLIPFYQSFGFQTMGEDYILDGIPHREMIFLP